MVSDEDIKKQIKNTLEKTDLGIGKKYEGKVRDNYFLKDKIVMVTSDRISAFDKVLGTIPFKGQILNQMAVYWFDHTNDICKNHILEIPDPNVMVVKKCNPYPVEVIVRGYITGSLWRAYEKGGRDMYGLDFPDALKKNQKLDEPILTPSTKAEQGEHDEPIAREEIISKGLVPKDVYEKIEEISLKLFERGTEMAAKQGLILVDTKYEFGELDGEIVLMDEIHTPDSSRYWIAESYDEKLKPTQLDKEHIRGWLMEQGYMGDGKPPKLTDDIKISLAKRYIQVFEQVTGSKFVPNVSDVHERMNENLKKYF